MNIEEKLKRQREFFDGGRTLSLDYRKEALLRLRQVIREEEEELISALHRDLGKSPYEAYATEIGMVYSEIRYMLRHMDSLSRPRCARVSLLNFPSTGCILQEPYGSVLLLTPWNYPVQLSLVPLVGAIAAGNCVVIKPSEYAEKTGKVLEKILHKALDERHVFVVNGGNEEGQVLLKNRFDYIFFTGGRQGGKAVLRAAAEHPTPVTLELGGKSPCIIDETADISLTARRIVWGKFINSGQTCVAPDYLYVHRKVKAKLMEALVRNIEALYGENPLESRDYCRIINEKHFRRLLGLLDGADLYYGGENDEKTLRIAPAIIDHADWSIPAMQEEIFGPILPIIAYEDVEEVISRIKRGPVPLALYLFTRSKSNERKILQEVPFGGGCINDTVMHLAASGLPFGGRGESGMGNYHGKFSFRTFSHEKSVLKKSIRIDLPMRYPPFGDSLRLLKLFMH